MKNSNLKSIFDQTGQKKIENNLGKGLLKQNTSSVSFIYLYAQENIFGNEIENMPRFSKVNCIATLCRSCYSTGSKFCTRDSFFSPQCIYFFVYSKCCYVDRPRDNKELLLGQSCFAP